mgnify:CR=1 FL=1
MKKNKVKPINIEVEKKPKKERFYKEQNVYASEISMDCPVMIQRGAILLDTLSGTKFLQLKLSNTGEKEIKSVYIKMCCINDVNEVVGNSIDADYSDVNCKQGTCFGAKTLIAIHSSAKKFQFDEVKIAYADGTTERFGKECYEPIPEAKSLKEVLPAEYHEFIDVQKDLCVQPEKMKDGITRCICGGIILKDGICASCGRDEQRSFADSTLEHIMKARQNYVIAEQKRIKAEEYKKHEQRNTKIAAGLLTIATVGNFFSILSLLSMLDIIGVGVFLLSIIGLIPNVLFIRTLLKRQRDKFLKYALGLNMLYDVVSSVILSSSVIVGGSSVILSLVLMLPEAFLLIYLIMYEKGKAEKLHKFLIIPMVVFALNGLVAFALNGLYGLYGIGMCLLTQWIKETTSESVKL